MTIITAPLPPEQDELQALIEEARRRARKRRQRLSAVLLAAVLAAAGLYVGFGGDAPGLSNHAGPGRPAPAVTSHAAGRARLGTPGMPGTIIIQAIISPTPARSLVFLNQCYPCRTAMACCTLTDWVAITDNGGRSWSLRPTPTLGSTVQFADRRDGWSSAGYVTHDGGLSWRKANVQSRYPVESVSVVGGRVWAIATGPCITRIRCVGFGAAVLVGSASGSTLAPVAHQPFRSGYKLGGIFGASPDTAYVTASGPDSVVQVHTRDGGHGWHRTPQLCAQPGGLSALDQVGAKVLWATCPLREDALLVRSTDGGRRWTTLRRPVSMASVYPVSSSVLWGLDERGSVTQSTDGGAHWQRVWTPPADTATFHAFTRTAFPALSIQGPKSAAVATLVSGTHGANLAVYRTIDAGRSWRESLAKLPARPPEPGQITCQAPVCYRTFPAESGHHGRP